jgi:hypothetical protein
MNSNSAKRIGNQSPTRPDKQEKPLLSENKSSRTNVVEMLEEDEFEDLHSKTMGSEIIECGVRKLESGELIDRSHVELAMGELIEEYRSQKRITLFQLINRIAEAKYRYRDYEFEVVIPLADDIIEMFKKHEDGGVDLKNEIQS